MGRPLRSSLADGVLHVVIRGNDRQAIFADDEERFFFLGLLDDACVRYGVRIVAFDLLTNHVHLVAVAAVADLSLAMRLLVGGYARWRNVRHGRRDHLFRNRFRARSIRTVDGQVLVVRYVLRNATTAGLVDDPAADPWSSLRMTIGAEEPLVALDAAFVVALFGGADGLLAFVAHPELPGVDHGWPDRSSRRADRAADRLA